MSYAYRKTYISDIDYPVRQQAEKLGLTGDLKISEDYDKDQWTMFYTHVRGGFCYTHPVRRRDLYRVTRAGISHAEIEIVEFLTKLACELVPQTKTIKYEVPVATFFENSGSCSHCAAPRRFDSGCEWCGAGKVLKRKVDKITREYPGPPK